MLSNKSVDTCYIEYQTLTRRPSPFDWSVSCPIASFILVKLYFKDRDPSCMCCDCIKYGACEQSYGADAANKSQQVFPPPVVPLSLASLLISSKTCKNAAGSSAPCTSYFPLRLSCVNRAGPKRCAIVLNLREVRHTTNKLLLCFYYLFVDLLTPFTALHPVPDLSLVQSSFDATSD